MCFSVMASPDQNVLIPRPGFPAYGTLLGHVGCEIREYEVLADREWECDLEAMERQIDEKTAFILIVSVSLHGFKPSSWLIQIHFRQTLRTLAATT
jgi:aspartate/methionine/tyrosine aminotransferase